MAFPFSDSRPRNHSGGFFFLAMCPEVSSTAPRISWTTLLANCRAGR